MRGDSKVLFPLSLSQQASCLHNLPACFHHWRTDCIKQGNGWIINQADWTTTCRYQMHQNSRVNCDATRFSYSKLGSCSKGWKGFPVIGRMLVLKLLLPQIAMTSVVKKLWVVSSLEKHYRNASPFSIPWDVPWEDRNEQYISHCQTLEWCVPIQYLKIFFYHRSDLVIDGMYDTCQYCVGVCPCGTTVSSSTDLNLHRWMAHISTGYRDEHNTG